MAGGGQKALLAALTASFMVAATVAAAQTVPLPPPKAGATPRSPAGSPPLRPPAPIQQQGSTQQGSTQQDSGQQNGGPSSWLPSIFGGGQKSQQDEAAAALEPAQRSLVNKVSSYLTRVQVMSGDFIQVGPDGRRAKGQFYVQKPGKVRFDYDPPSRIDIIADGSSVVVRDRQLGTQDAYALSQTPLRFLLADRIDLLRDTTVTAVFADDLYVTVVVEEKQVLIGTSRLTMMFGAKDFHLKQWVVTDPQGYDTSVAVSNVDTVRRPDPSLFHIDLTQYRN
jgi:outer membrane lipoprotein-sorting protein